MSASSLGWIGIARLGLVQTALGAIVVLTTSTINRVMVVELALPAMLPGALVAMHYAVQILRPRWGFGSDVGGRRTPWIVGGMAALALGGVGAALATAWMATNVGGGIALATLSFLLIGVGVGASGTSLLALLATSVETRRKPAAATIVWVMMIFGFVLTAGVGGHFLDPFSPARLVLVTSVVSGLAFLVTLVAVYGVESRREPASDGATAARAARPSFAVALKEIWSEPQARRFTVFVFVSMLAYSAQDLILEPFAGAVFGLTPGESTQLAGLQHGGVLLGMLIVGFGGSTLAGRGIGSIRVWMIGGCLASAVALLGIAAGGLVGPQWPLGPNVVLLGVSNGVFAVAAIGSMMTLAGTGRENREGLRIGLWGSGQAIAFGVGGFLGTVAVDGARAISGSPAAAYIIVFAVEAMIFLVAAWLALRVSSDAQTERQRGAAAPFAHRYSAQTGGG